MELLLSLLYSPEVFIQCFTPIGFMKSFNGVNVYHGEHLPLVTCQYSGKMEISPVPTVHTSGKGRVASNSVTYSGAKLNYVVGMKSNGVNDTFNYVYPALVHSDDDNVVSQCKSLMFCQKTKQGMPTPCFVKNLGSFALNYQYTAGTPQSKQPRVDLNMQKDYTKVYV